MTGTNWPYPAPLEAGSNAIGVGAVGVAPVGDIPLFNWRQTILSQYANADQLINLIQSFFGAADQTQNFDTLYDDVINLDTAVGYGLDRWGRIVGVNRVLQVANQHFFGFASDALPFGDASFQGYAADGVTKVWAGVDPNAGGGVFYAGGALTSNYSMGDQTYRQVIYAKAAANICSGAIPAINKILLNLFPGRGNAYVQEGVLPQFFGFAFDALPFGQGPFYSGQQISRLSITYVFRFALSPVEQAIVTQSGVLPKPPGIPASVAILP